MMNNASSITLNVHKTTEERNNFTSLLALAKKLTESVTIEDIVEDIHEYFTNQLKEDLCRFREILFAEE